MNIIGQIDTSRLSHGSMAVIGIVGILAVFLAFKVAKFLLKVFLILLGLTAVGAAVWWFVLRH
jgi:hypothetical protein